MLWTSFPVINSHTQRPETATQYVTSKQDKLLGRKVVLILFWYLEEKNEREKLHSLTEKRHYNDNPWTTLPKITPHKTFIRCTLPRLFQQHIHPGAVVWNKPSPNYKKKSTLFVLYLNISWNSYFLRSFLIYNQFTWNRWNKYSKIKS